MKWHPIYLSTLKKVSFFKHILYFRMFLHETGRKRVVVTGVGVVCPLGVGAKHVWSNLLQGATNVTALPENDYSGIPCQVAAFVPRGNQCGELNFEKSFRQTDLKAFSLATAYALIAAEEAILDAGLLTQHNKEFKETGVAVGTGMVDLMDIVNTGNLLSTKGYSKVSPFFVPRILNNMTSGHIAIKYGFKGPNHCVSTACATGLHAIGDAYSFIQNNHASVMICGGSEAVISPLSIAAFSRMRALSTHFNSQPVKASRPFDRDRDGFVMGEGAGIMVLESLQHAVGRCAKIYAEVKGYGLCGDAHHMTSPPESGDGAFRCMKQALVQSHIDPAEVGYVNAHATSTPLGDASEIKAIHNLFGSHATSLCVSSSKGAIGHLLGAAGSVEAILTVLSCYNKRIPPNVNLENLDIQWPVNVMGKEAEGFPEICVDRCVALKNSFGFGGTNASLVFCTDFDEKAYCL